MKMFDVCLLTYENVYFCKVNESIQNALTQKGVQFVPWFAGRSCGKKQASRWSRP